MSTSGSSSSSPKQTVEEVALDRVKQCFKKYQTKHRTVNRDSIERILRDLNLMRADYMKKFDKVLRDNAFQLDFQQFIKILEDLCGVFRVDATEAALREAFNTIDRDNDGFINRKDLKAAAPLLSVKPKDVQKMMRVADTNKDGRVDFEEFLAIFGYKK